MANGLISRARQAGVVLGVGGIALLGVACAPDPAPPVPTIPPGATTVTSAVSLNCVGVGFAAGTPIAPQVANVSITSPTTVAAGATFAATVAVAPITVSAPPAGIDLNAFNIPGKTALSATNGTVTGGAVSGVPTHFAGAIATIPAASTNVTAGSAGVLTLTTGQIDIITGSTGFTCTVTGGAPVKTITVS